MYTDQQHIAATDHSEEEKDHQMTSDSDNLQAGFAGQCSEQYPVSRERSAIRRPEAAREL